jgi:hypothetical protein
MVSNRRSRSPTTGWRSGFGPGQVQGDVVSRPPGAEGLATGGQLTDEIGEHLVEGAAAGLAAQQCDDVVDGLVRRVRDPLWLHQARRRPEQARDAGFVEVRAAIGCRLRTTSPVCDRPGDRDQSAGGETHERVSALGAFLQFTIARLR